jgi:hypothetical protein
MSDELIIGGQRIRPGARQKLEIPVADLYTGSEVTMPVYVARGKKPGPVMFVSAAVHGDELNGIEIIRRLIAQKNAETRLWNLNRGAHGERLWSVKPKPLLA